MPEQTARVNALLGGQVDAAVGVPAPQAKSYQEQGDSSPIKVLIANGPNSVFFTMGTETAPFTDVRVRQAFRLVVDRPAMVEQVHSGLGEVANDLWGIGDELYNTELPQREQDHEQARSLLKQAGQEGLNITLSTSDFYAGMVESATLFQEQAKGAGINVELRRIPASSYFTQGWPNYQFGQSYWSYYPIPTWYNMCYLSTSPFNETQWRNRKTDDLYHDALGETDEARAKEKWFALQEIFHETGGNIFWGTTPLIDGLAKRVNGAVPNAAFHCSGGNLEDWWLSS
jgi:peptide/nickel transport system substrate-binding protein